MIRITISNTEFETKSGISRGGRPYMIHEQVGIVDLPNGERRRIKVQLDEEDGKAQPLVPGSYAPKPSAFYVGQFDALAISTRSRHWQAEAAAARKAA